MNHLIDFPLEDGTHLLVEGEIREIETCEVKTPQSRNVIVKAQQNFDEAMDKIKPAASVIIAKLRSIHDSPNEIEVQFGIKLSADAGAFVASAGVEANYLVTLKWKDKKQK